jgi:L-2,4-diaminobutyrate transaminase
VKPPRGYYEKLQPVLQESDILFIVDEVITGFGRIGEWFGTGFYGLQPDIVTLAKGLTSAYFPVSASVIGERIWSVLAGSSSEFGPVMHGFTYSGHPVGAAIGLVNLDILEKEGLPANSRQMGRYLLEALRSSYLDHPFIGDVRGEGLMIGIEFIADKRTRRPFAPGSNPHQTVARLAPDNGLMIRGLPIMETVAFSPPLCITEAECAAVVERFGRTLEQATPELAAAAKAT